VHRRRRGVGHIVAAACLQLVCIDILPIFALKLNADLINEEIPHFELFMYSLSSVCSSFRPFTLLSRIQCLQFPSFITDNKLLTLSPCLYAEGYVTVFFWYGVVCSQKLQLRAEVADVFLAKFQLRPEEVQILRGTRDGILHPVSSCL